MQYLLMKLEKIVCCLHLLGVIYKIHHVDIVQNLSFTFREIKFEPQSVLKLFLVFREYEPSVLIEHAYMGQLDLNFQIT